MEQDLYEKMIMYYDPEVHFADVEDAGFIGQGKGVYSLNSYRKVTLLVGDKKLPAFEKVFLRDSPDFKKMSWFYEEIYPQIGSHLDIPEIILIKGKRLAVVYFVWFEDLSVPGKDCIIDVYKKVSGILDKVEVSNDMAKQKVISDFSVSSFFHPKYKRAQTWLSVHMGPDNTQHLELICKSVSENSSVKWGFVHGDLNATNLTNTGLIDFDYCGFHPKMFEYASFIRFHFRLKNRTDFYEVCRSMDLPLQNRDEMLALLFFYFVLSFSKGGKASNDFLKTIWSELEGHAKRMGILRDGVS